MINIKLKKAVAIENAKAVEEAKLSVRDSSDAEAKLAEAEAKLAEAEALRKMAEEQLAKAKAEETTDKEG